MSAYMYDELAGAYNRERRLRAEAENRADAAGARVAKIQGLLEIEQDECRRLHEANADLRELRRAAEARVTALTQVAEAAQDYLDAQTAKRDERHGYLVGDFSLQVEPRKRLRAALSALDEQEPR